MYIYKRAKEVMTLAGDRRKRVRTLKQLRTHAENLAEELLLSYEVFHDRLETGIDALHSPIDKTTSELMGRSRSYIGFARRKLVKISQLPDTDADNTQAIKEYGRILTYVAEKLPLLRLAERRLNEARKKTRRRPRPAASLKLVQVSVHPL